MGVGHLDRVALEKGLIDHVEEVLFFAEVFEPAGSRLNGSVKAVERAKEAVAVEAQTHQRVNHFFQLDGDNVAAGEIGIVENRSD